MTTNSNRVATNWRHLIKNTKTDDTRVVVVVGTVTDDPLFHTERKLKVCAMKFTANARARILRNGGQCLTLDQ